MFKISLLSMDVLHLFGESLQGLLMFVNLLRVFWSFSDHVVILELIDFSLNFGDVSLKDSDLLEECLVYLLTFLPLLLLSALNDLTNIVDVSVSKGDWLDVLLLKLISWVSVQHHKPLDEIIVLIHQSLSLFAFHLLKFLHEADQSFGVASFLSQVFLDLLYLL
jgi:hypothetical protein